MGLRVVIIGTGPIGLEAALACIDQGHEVTVIERGQPVENVRRWGHVQLFSPFAMNSSERGRIAVQQAGTLLPEMEAMLTGAELREFYLLPLAKLISERATVLTETCVRNISREATLKGEMIGRSARLAQPFRLLIEQVGREMILHADVVLDCSGTYGHHRWLGSGGIPCPGERTASKYIRYDLPDINDQDRNLYAGQTTLVIGGGYSAATNVVALAALAVEDSDTNVFWITRHQFEQPMQRIEQDTLPVRDALTIQANQLVERGRVQWISGSSINEIQEVPQSHNLKVLYTPRDGTPQSLEVDKILANVGFQPDRSLYEELQIHECYATQGPMKLAAALLGETSADCLAQSSLSANTLKNPEPNFFILGAKSYGRNSRFLIRIGLEQIEQVLEMFITSLSGTDR